METEIKNIVPFITVQENDILRYKLENYAQDPNAENYKMMIKEIRQYLN